MINVPNSQVPAYLDRSLNEVDSRLKNNGKLPVTRFLPNNPVVGKLYYFGNAISGHAVITAEGLYVYKSSGYAFIV